MQPNPSRFIERFHGIFPAIPTPFTLDGELDLPAIDRLVEHLVGGGVHGIWALGSGGEFPCLSADQKQRSLKAIIDVVDGRVPVLAGISDTAVSDAVAAAAAAAELGADAVFTLAPYYYRYNERDACRYIDQVAAGSPLPLVIYHNAHNSGIRLSIDAIAALADHENIVGIKDSSCDFALFQAIFARLDGRDDFVVFQGDDTALASGFLLGAAGAVAALPVLAPRLIVDLYEAARAGDAAGAHALQQRGMDLFQLFEVTGTYDDSAFLANQKAALELMGLCTRVPAPPCAPLADQYMPRVRDILNRHDLLPEPAAKTRVG